MRKIQWIIWMLLIGMVLNIPTGFALEKSEMTVLNLTSLSQVEKPNGYTSVQGGTTTDKYIITLFINESEDSDGKCAILVLDKDTYEVVPLKENPIIEYNFGHANDATYNSKTNELIILSGRKLNFIDLENDRFELTKTIELKKYYHGIGYDEENNQYVLSRTIEGGTLFEIRNEEFEIQNTFTMETNLTKQSLTVYQGNIYYVCYEAGRITKYEKVYDGILKRRENAIYVYSLEGEKKTIYYIPYSYREVIFGEIENISFRDSKMLIQFNHAQKAGYFTTEYSKEVNTKISISTEENNEEYILYEEDEEIARAKSKNNTITYNIRYTDEKTHIYTIQKTSKETSSSRKEEINEVLEEDYEKAIAKLEVTVYYDPVVNKLRTSSNEEEILFTNNTLYNSVELKKLREAFIVEVPDTSRKEKTSYLGIFLLGMSAWFIEKRKEEE